MVGQSVCDATFLAPSEMTQKWKICCVTLTLKAVAAAPAPTITVLWRGLEIMMWNCSNIISNDWHGCCNYSCGFTNTLYAHNSRRDATSFLEPHNWSALCASSVQLFWSFGAGKINFSNQRVADNDSAASVEWAVVHKFSFLTSLIQVQLELLFLKLLFQQNCKYLWENAPETVREPCSWI
jgi:hypothetical protein